MRTFALAALAAFASAQFDDLPFDPTDADLLADLGITVDVSKCESIIDPTDSNAVRQCLDQVESVLKGIDYEGILDAQWVELKREADYQTAVQLWEAIPFYSAAQADADAAEIAELIDSEIKSSKLIDAGLWTSIYEDGIELATDPEAAAAIDLNALTAKAEAVSAAGEDLVESLEDNAEINAAIAEFEEILSDDGALVQAYENDTAVKAAIDAIYENEGLTDALLADLSTAIEGSTEMQDAIDAAATQLNVIADEAYGEITTAVDDILNDKIPALIDEVDAQLPSSVGDFIGAAFSESNDFLQKLNDSDAVSNSRTALQEQLQSIADVSGSEEFASFITKSEELGDSVQAAGNELLESESGFSLTASVAAVLAVTTLAF